MASDYDDKQKWNKGKTWWSMMCITQISIKIRSNNYRTRPFSVFTSGVNKCLLLVCCYTVDNFDYFVFIVIWVPLLISHLVRSWMHSYFFEILPMLINPTDNKRAIHLFIIQSRISQANKPIKLDRYRRLVNEIVYKNHYNELVLKQ